MATLQLADNKVLALSDEQVLSLLPQLSPEARQRAEGILFAELRRTRLEPEEMIRAAAADRGLNWDAMSEDERDSFVAEWTED